MADVVGCSLSYGYLVSPSRERRVRWVLAATGGGSGGKKTLEMKRPEKKRSDFKMHRSWTPGRRVSKERYASKELEEQEDEDEDMELSDAEEEDDEDRDARSTYRVSQLNCQHFGRCSGCLFENGLNNPPVYRDAITFFQKRRIEKLELIPSATRGWRCRAKLAVRGTSEEPLIGLFEESSHQIVDIPECRAHHPSINAAIALLKAVIKDVGVHPYDELTGSGQLRYVQVVVNSYVTSVPFKERRKHGKVQVSLVWNARDEKSPGSEMLHKLAYCLWRRGSTKEILHSVWANFQTTRSNVILGQRWRRLHGEEELWERVGGVDICYAPSSFGQANYQAFEDLLRRLQKYVRKGSAVSDLFAGVGVIGLSLAATRNCRLVKCVEVNKHCQSSFEQSLTRLPRHVDCQLTWHCADATEAPITWLEGSDVVIVDPPRKGLEPALIEALRTASLRARGKTESPSLKENNKIEKRPWVLRAKDAAVQRQGTIQESGDGIWPERLIYVSCGWETFKQDCEALEENGHWHLARAHAFNFFPGTDSLEILAVFKVGKRNKKILKKYPNFL